MSGATIRVEVSNLTSKANVEWIAREIAEMQGVTSVQWPMKLDGGGS